MNPYLLDLLLVYKKELSWTPYAFFWHTKNCVSYYYSCFVLYMSSCFCLFYRVSCQQNQEIESNISCSNKRPKKTSVAKKRGELPSSFLHVEKVCIPSFKILQLVHARNRPIPQLFVRFLVESNSHQYDSREWLPGPGFPYKGHDGDKDPL